MSVCEYEIVVLLIFVIWITVDDSSVFDVSGLSGFDLLRSLFVVGLDFVRVALDLVDRLDR